MVHSGLGSDRRRLAGFAERFPRSLASFLPHQYHPCALHHHFRSYSSHHRYSLALSFYAGTPNCSTLRARCTLCNVSCGSVAEARVPVISPRRSGRLKCAKLPGPLLSAGAASRFDPAAFGCALGTPAGGLGASAAARAAFFSAIAKSASCLCARCDEGA